ncbi:hypothetical protein GGR54DRAFT_301656 [Hypoxylon sp. NC1633]|nr:hypothetical protein GGR54DRAFT_301656 [Hypoxylon sp. NC1633]
MENEPLEAPGQENETGECPHQTANVRNDTAAVANPSPSNMNQLSRLKVAKRAYKQSRVVSNELKERFETFRREVEPDREPDEERPERDRDSELKLVSMGIELAKQRKEMARLGRDVTHEEMEAGMLTTAVGMKRLRRDSRRQLSAGDELWRYKKKKLRLETEPGVSNLTRLNDLALSESVLAIYRKCDGQGSGKKRPSNFRREALEYYEASGEGHGLTKDSVWCHVSGMWHPSGDTKAAHIVPFFFDNESLGEILFGERAPSLDRAGNALFLQRNIERWFNKYHLVVVPLDASEHPITRWRTDILNPSILNVPFSGSHTAAQLDGKELQFLNDKRPVSRFVYFHFVVALLRIRDIRSGDWRDIWARYYEQRPFPTPTPYMRRGMLLALSTFYETTDMTVVESWMAGHGLNSSSPLKTDEEEEAARQVMTAVEATINRAEEKSRKDQIVDESDPSADEATDEDSHSDI